MVVQIGFHGEDSVYLTTEVTQAEYNLLVKLEAELPAAKKQQDAKYAPSLSINLLIK